jgi:predicted ribosome quality control (RQC) complex YloA/Tae2 family protein
VIQPLWITHQKQTKAQHNDYNIKNFKLKNLTGVIGLDAVGNDWIRAQASKDHYWFHIENYTGSHCIIKTDDLTQLSIDDLGAIGSMLRDFSKLEILEIPVLYTQLKNIKGIKGTKGAVTVKKAKHLRCLYSDWKEIISIL